MIEREREREREREQTLTTLNQIQQYFLTNNIHQITKQDDGSLLINFDSNSSDNSSQITVTNDQQLNETDNEKKSIWKKFKLFVGKKGKNSLDKQELAREINNLKNNSPNNENQPTNYFPYILGGIGIIVVVGLIIILTNKKRK